MTVRLASVVGAQGMLALGFALLHGVDATRIGATIAFLIAAPALAIVMGLRGIDPFVLMVIALAAVTVVNTVVAEVILATGKWSIPAGVAAVGMISAGIGLAACAGSSSSILSAGTRRAAVAHAANERGLHAVKSGTQPGPIRPVEQLAAIRGPHHGGSHG